MKSSTENEIEISILRIKCHIDNEQNCERDEMERKISSPEINFFQLSHEMGWDCPIPRGTLMRNDLALKFRIQICFLSKTVRMPLLFTIYSSSFKNEGN